MPHRNVLVITLLGWGNDVLFNVNQLHSCIWDSSNCDVWESIHCLHTD